MIEAIIVANLMKDVDFDRVSANEVLCLAENIYHEARGESLLGQQAVAHVTLNRVADNRWPDSICDVVYQKSQFSWVSNSPAIHNIEAFENSVSVALNAIREISEDPTNGATFFLQNSISPRWSRSLEVSVVIGGHKFLR